MDNAVVGRITKGVLIFLGVGQDDEQRQADWLAEKIAGLRIFEDPEGKMNLSLVDVGGEVLVVSQFTLFGDCRKGRRPSFAKAGPPDKARALYEAFVSRLKQQVSHVDTGVFQAHMDVSLVNDGPVTLWLDTEDN